MPKHILFIITIVLTSSLLRGNAEAGMFSITINPSANIDPTTESLFMSAVNFWESSLLGTQEDIDINLVIDASTPTIDGNGNVLGSASNSNASYLTNNGLFLYATLGSMRFDIDDITGMNQTTLYNIILHEMAHVIGFGTLWNSDRFSVSGFQDVYENGSGEYTGEYALALYQEIYDSSATYVPIELDGGSGTANSHWDEGFINDPSELLTGYLDPNPYVSDISLASFADIGYVVQLSDGRILGIVPAPTGFLFLLIFLVVSLSRAHIRKSRFQSIAI